MVSPFVEQLFPYLVDNSRFACASFACLVFEACPREATDNVNVNHTQLPHGSQNQTSHPLAARDAPKNELFHLIL